MISRGLRDQLVQPFGWLRRANTSMNKPVMRRVTKFDNSLLTGTTTNDDIPVLGLYEFCLTKPGSITKTTPSMVIDVSAIFVARTTFLAPGGVGSKILACMSLGKFAYIGQMISSAILFPRARAVSCKFSCAASISSWPCWL